MELSPVPANPDPAHGLAGLKIIEPLCAVFRKKLKEEGLKYTPERAQILDAITQMGDVFEADQLLKKMEDDGFRVSKATIYRTIKLLSDAGILQQILVDGDQAHYVLAYGQRPIGILVDVETNQITRIEVPELAQLRDRVCADHGLVPEGLRFVVYGSSSGASQR